MALNKFADAKEKLEKGIQGGDVVETCLEALEMAQKKPVYIKASYESDEDIEEFKKDFGESFVYKSGTCKCGRVVCNVSTYCDRCGAYLIWED